MHSVHLLHHSSIALLLAKPANLNEQIAEVHTIHSLSSFPAHLLWFLNVVNGINKMVPNAWIGSIALLDHKHNVSRMRIHEVLWQIRDDESPFLPRFGQCHVVYRVHQLDHVRHISFATSVTVLRHTYLRCLSHFRGIVNPITRQLVKSHECTISSDIFPSLDNLTHVSPIPWPITHCSDSTYISPCAMSQLYYLKCHSFTLQQCTTRI